MFEGQSRPAGIPDKGSSRDLCRASTIKRSEDGTKVRITGHEVGFVEPTPGPEIEGLDDFNASNGNASRYLVGEMAIGNFCVQCTHFRADVGSNGCDQLSELTEDVIGKGSVWRDIKGVVSYLISRVPGIK